MPAHRHQAHLEGEHLFIDTHALTVSQLFFDGILKADGEPIQVKVGRREIGLFLLEGLVLKKEPMDLTNDRFVRLHLRQVKEQSGK